MSGSSVCVILTQSCLVTTLVALMSQSPWDSAHQQQVQLSKSWFWDYEMNCGTRALIQWLYFVLWLQEMSSVRKAVGSWKRQSVFLRLKLWDCYIASYCFFFVQPGFGTTVLCVLFIIGHLHSQPVLLGSWRPCNQYHFDECWTHTTFLTLPSDVGNLH